MCWHDLADYNFRAFFLSEAAGSLHHPKRCLLAPTGALVLMMVYYISEAATHFFRFGAFMPFYTVTSVTLSRLNSINAIDVTAYLGDILGIFLVYFGDILEIFWGYFGDILGIF